MPNKKTSAEYLIIGEKLKTAEFRGVVVTKLRYIEKSINGLRRTDNAHSKKILELQKFQANMTGKFAVIGSLIIVAMNWAWDLGSGFVKSLKGQ